MEEAIEPGDASPLTGPPDEAPIARVPPPPPASRSPPKAPPNNPGKENSPRDEGSMGTVLSLSPQERRAPANPPAPLYKHRDYMLNNLNYEQLNNAKNRENKNAGIATVAMVQPLNHPGNNNSLQNNNINLNNNDNARIISEKSALEKNLKKHSLFINALSWKRFSTINNNKKKILDNNKNKNITFRQALDNIPIVDKNKNIQTPQVRFQPFSFLRPVLDLGSF